MQGSLRPGGLIVSACTRHAIEQFWKRWHAKISVQNLRRSAPGVMWSYPNYVPLPAAEVQRIGQRLDALDFDAVHSAFWERGDIERDAKAAVQRSVVRHINGLQRFPFIWDHSGDPGSRSEPI